MGGGGGEAGGVKTYSPAYVIPNCKQGALRAVRYNVDGQYLMTCGADRTIKLWNPERALLLSTYQGHSGDVLDVKGSCDNSQLASGATDKNVFLWDVGENRLIRRWRGHNSSVTAIQFNENSQVIISGSQDNTIKLWDTRSSRTNQREIQSLEECTDTVTSMAVTNHSLLVGCADGYVRLYDLRQGTLSTDCMSEAVTCVAVSRDMASHLISVADESIKLIDKESGELLACYKGHSGPQFKDYKIEVAFDFSDRFVLGASPNGQVFVWDLITEKVQGLCKVNDSNVHSVTSLTPHPQTAKIGCGVGGGVYVFDLDEEGTVSVSS